MILLEVASKSEVSSPLWNLICMWEFWLFGVPCLWVVIMFWIFGIKAVSNSPKGLFDTSRMDDEAVDEE